MTHAPVLAGSAAYALSDLFGWKKGLAKKPQDARGFYAIIAIATLLGLGINFIGISPIKALLYAAIINCIASVPITAFVILLANKKAIMGKHKNGRFSNLFGWLTFATVFSTSLLTLTGSGGCGKTRLAIEVASNLAGEFVDEVCTGCQRPFRNWKSTRPAQADSGKTAPGGGQGLRIGF